MGSSKPLLPTRLPLEAEIGHRTDKGVLRLLLCSARSGLLGIALLLGYPCGRNASAVCTADDGPQVRIGVRQGLTRIQAVCAAGLVGVGPSGETLVNGAHFLRLEVKPIPGEGSAHSGLPSWAATAVNLETLEERQFSVPLCEITLRSRRPGVLIDANGHRFRGELALFPEPGGRLTLVNVLSLEEYLRGVLPAEMAPSAPFEALLAQAIVARTFALASLGRHAREGFDLCASNHCQVYGGVAREHPTTNRAVEQTRGQVLLCQGKPFTALFHAVCGGATDSPMDVWSKPTEPGCFKGIVDAKDPLGLDLTAESGIQDLANRREEVFCGDSPDFFWEMERTREELERTFARTLPIVLGAPAPLGELRTLSVVSRTISGRATALLVEGSQGSYLVRGEGIRWLFGTGRPNDQGLKSCRFVVQPMARPEAPGAPPVRYRLVGFGWGHGVGLCQAGAIGMAKKGYLAAEILAHYFPEAQIGPYGE